LKIQYINSTLRVIKCQNLLACTGIEIEYIYIEIETIGSQGWLVGSSEAG